jgi:hypothetical protein
MSGRGRQQEPESESEEEEEEEEEWPPWTFPIVREDSAIPDDVEVMAVGGECPRSVQGWQQLVNHSTAR